MRHVSEYGMEGPLEQQTNSTKANTRANDKWAQEGTHGPKCKVGGPLGSRPTCWSADLPMGPTDVNLTCGES